MHRLTGDPISSSNLDDGPLLDHTQLHQHDDDPQQLGNEESSPAKRAQHRQARTVTRNTGTGASVAQLPEPVREMSPTYRSQHVNHDPGQHTPPCYLSVTSLAPNIKTQAAATL